MKLSQVGSVGFEQLRVRCLIGADPHEKVQEQNIFIDLKVESDWSACLASDQLQDAIDYVKIAEVCNQVAAQGHHALLESLAYQIVSRLFETYAAISHVWIRICKPQVLPAAKDAYVEFHAKRPS